MELTFQTYSSKITATLLCALTLCMPVGAQDTAVDDNAIRIGGSLPLRGPASYYGISYKSGLDAALNGIEIQGRTIDYLALDDGFDPARAQQNSLQLLDQSILAMVGNVGTLNATVTLPLLAERNIPAVAFASGSDVLGQTSSAVFNYRPSYQREALYVAETALAAGINPFNICLFIQDNGLGLAAVQGVAEALAEAAPAQAAQLAEIAARIGSGTLANFSGPVGITKADSLIVRDAFDSLLDWERTSGNACRLVVSGATARVLDNFIGYSHYKQKGWLFSALSVTASDAFLHDLKQYGASDRVIVSQVTPPLDAPFPAVAQAREALGNGINYISLEGYLAGKMLLSILQTIPGEINHASFITAARAQPHNIGGLTIDFSKGNHGSDLITLTRYREDNLVPLSVTQLQQLLP